MKEGELAIKWNQVLNELRVIRFYIIDDFHFIIGDDYKVFIKDDGSKDIDIYKYDSIGKVKLVARVPLDLIKDVR